MDRCSSPGRPPAPRRYAPTARCRAARCRRRRARSHAGWPCCAAGCSSGGASGPGPRSGRAPFRSGRDWTRGWWCRIRSAGGSSRGRSVRGRRRGRPWWRRRGRRGRCRRGQGYGLACGRITLMDVRSYTWICAGVHFAAPLALFPDPSPAGRERGACCRRRPLPKRRKPAPSPAWGRGSARGSGRASARGQPASAAPQASCRSVCLIVCARTATSGIFASMRSLS
ncbi:hypothetical protein OJJOAM_000455 [Cupriavidus sp. H18C1]